MKKILLSISCFLAAIFSIRGQVLYGTTRTTINKFIPPTNNLSVVYSAEVPSGTSPYYMHFIQASDGKLYGTTADGGKKELGTIFSYDPSTATYTTLKDFDIIDGYFPAGSLVQASNGKLYGMTAGGGNFDYGVIFSFDPATSTYIKLMDFEGWNGANPYGSLVQASDGKLYGMTHDGGGNGSGVIFSFDPSTSTYTKIKDFDGINGGHPYGSLMQASDGKLYGMTFGTSFGVNGSVIFSLDPATSIYTVLKVLASPDGTRPYGSLVQASDGKLYGMTSASFTGPGQPSACGSIFSFDPVTNIYSQRLNLDCTNGSSPRGDLIQAGNGKLYGMTESGGTSDVGTIFSFEPLSSTYTKLKDFNISDGAHPFGSLMEASDGKLYGLTVTGGVGVGVIFSFDPSGPGYTKLKDLGATLNGGSFFSSGLVQAGDGKLYGTTEEGGNKNRGVIFSLDPSTSTYTKLKDFDDINGANPEGRLVLAKNGKLYGTTRRGGSKDSGVIFSFDPLSSTYTKLMDFNKTDGSFPDGDLIQARDGKLYGVTQQGGMFNSGVIFSFDPSSSTYKKLKDFDVLFAGPRRNGLVEASNGKLYGLTFNTIYSFDPSSSRYEKLMQFNNEINGKETTGHLVQATNGKLYGLTRRGGTAGRGVIFSFNPSNSHYNKLVDLIDTASAFPTGSLMQASDGKLYGMNTGFNVGAIFSFDPSTTTYTRLKDVHDNGAYSWESEFVEIGKVNECICRTWYRDADGDGFGDPGHAKKAHQKPAGYVGNNGDCNDNDKTVYPRTYYRDADGDNLGDASISISMCNSASPAGYVKNKDDDNDHEKLQYALLNYPNPFQGTSTVMYKLPFDSKVSIKVYDLLGRAVATLVNENKKAGIYTVPFNVAGMKNGTLYYRIIAVSKEQRFEQTNKMIQLR